MPFNVYRILVKDRTGHPLYDFDWSYSNVNETVFTGFINAVQVMSEEVMHIGGVVDIILKEGILTLKESKYITVGLVASKSSKLLREALINFSHDFEIKFERELKKSNIEMFAYESAYELIEKYFSNFPVRIITSKKQPLLLSEKYVKVPSLIDNKLKNIFVDEKEYEFIKAEMQKSPTCVPSEFFALYDELKKEMDKLLQEDSESSKRMVIEDK